MFHFHKWKRIRVKEINEIYFENNKFKFIHLKPTEYYICEKCKRIRTVIYGICSDTITPTIYNRKRTYLSRKLFLKKKMVFYYVESTNFSKFCRLLETGKLEKPKFNPPSF